MNICSCDDCSAFSSKCPRLSYLSSLFKLVAEENRLKIMCLLKNKKHCICEIVDELDLSQSLISHHMSDLRQANLVSNEKKGQKTYYQLTNLGRQVVAGFSEY